jgi:hypothetical protein
MPHAPMDWYLKWPIPVPLPGKLGRVLRAGALPSKRSDVCSTTAFVTWLVAGPSAPQDLKIAVGGGLSPNGR